MLEALSSMAAMCDLQTLFAMGFASKATYRLLLKPLISRGCIVIADRKSDLQTLLRAEKLLQISLHIF